VRRTSPLLSRQKIRLNRTKSDQIRLNQAILKHFLFKKQRERDHPDRCAERLASHSPAKSGEMGDGPKNAMRSRMEFKNLCLNGFAVIESVLKPIAAEAGCISEKFGNDKS
jgi:hypothetical protein